MAIDITSPEDRANIFSDLNTIANSCLPDNGKTKELFNLLFKVWEKVSGDLWFLCYWNDYFRCGNIILQAAINTNNIQVQAQLLGELGWAYMEGDHYIHAQEYFEESLQKYQLLQEPLKECNLLRYLGILAHRQRQEKTALVYFYQAKEVLQTKRNQIPIDHKLAFFEAELPNVIGCLYLDSRDFDASYQQLHLSLKNYQLLLENYPSWRNWYRYYQLAPLLDLGQWHFLQQDYQQAKYYYQECLTLSREISRNDKIAEVLLSLANLAEVEGNRDEAIKLAGEAERVAGIEIPILRDRAAVFKEKLLCQLPLSL